VEGKARALHTPIIPQRARAVVEDTAY